MEAIAERLWEEEQNARRYLGMCGLEVLVSEYTDNFLLETLYGLIDKKTSRHQKLSQDIFETVSQVYQVTDEALETMMTGGVQPDEAQVPD